MPAIRKACEIPPQNFEHCHEGIGTLFCRSLLEGQGAKTIEFMHHDVIPAGVTIGSHPHDWSEEVYYLVSGRGVLLYDGVEYDMAPGDLSLCTPGHNHGFKALEECLLIVVGARVHA